MVMLAISPFTESKGQQLSPNDAAHGSSSSRPTAPTSIPSTWPSPSLKRIGKGQKRGALMPHGKPSVQSASSVNPMNVETSPDKPGIFQIYRKMR